MEKLQLSNVYSYMFLLVTITLIFCPINGILSSSSSSSSSSECGEFEFKCHSDGKCIKTENVCDKKKDCADNSDEEDCDLCLAPNWHQCKGSHVCISSGFVCDGQENCPDGDDEDNCVDHEHVHEKCGKYEYACLDKACIPLDMVCDGRKNCADGSDESVGCLHAEEKCKGFFCNNKKCLESKSWVCDGIDDCGDESDEHNCAWNCKPEENKFLCKDNDTCIPLLNVCDKVPQCSDKSDENGLCNDLKFNCTTNPCPAPSQCHQLPITGPTCICPKGYKFNTDMRKCEDINECEKYGICSQKCTNTDGSYECSCTKKYVLKNDGRTCAVQGGEPLLLYTTQRSVVGVYLNSRHMYNIADNLTQVIGVAYDGKHIYWTNIQHHLESLVRSKEDGSNQEILLTSGIEAPEDLAIDWLTGNIYFSDNILKHISVCSNNGHYCKILISINIDQPRGIALHPQKGIMFWTDWGQTPMIGKSNMDGSEFIPLITSNIHWPNCIALDPPNDRLYWVDAKLTKIESINLNGNDRRIVLTDILKHPYGISVFEDSIYWSDWETKSLHSCNKFTGKYHQVIAKNKRIYAVHVYHSALQPKIINPCDKMGCSHLCLLAGNTSNCACPEDMILGVEQRICIKIVKKQKLYIGMGNSLLEMEHTTFGRHQILQGYTLNMFIHHMEFNSINRTIFIADNMRKIIYEFNPLTKKINELVYKNLGNITALSFDNLAQNLYWTDAERHTIEVLSLRKNQRSIVHFFLGIEKPISLVVIPDIGKMFVALQSKNHSHIDTLSLHGRGPQHYTYGKDIGNGGIQLILDEPEKDIFWLDRENGKLEYANYETYFRSLFITNLNKPYSIALVDDDILWTSREKQSIYWTNSKHNFGSIKQFQIENPKINIHSTIFDDITLLSSKPIMASIDHHCLHNNGDCSHICVSIGKFSSACVCPTGMIFKDNKNQTCIDYWDCEFRCKSGECLTASRKCNGHKDCADGSDEQDCDSKDLDKLKKKICRLDEFACADGTQCIRNSLRCDKDFDCKDKSDEHGCEDIDYKTKCRINQFRCNNGRCVDLTTICDDFDDCGDKSDERNCPNSKDKNLKKCSANMFQCTNGQCIAKPWECDGHIDCTDGSDEHDNCASKTCQKGMFQCRLGQCIDSQLICDGHNDCGDNSDELNCDSERQIVCGDEVDSFGDPTKFQCTSNLTLCLDISAKCNKTAECPRGEDEIGCGGCSIYEFECKNKECIRKEFRCDNEKDCTDGSDENDCDHYNSTINQNHFTTSSCHDGMFTCKDGKCIEYSRVCDDHKDCAQGEDETALCKTACNSNPCQQKCTASPYGATCSCRDGYRLNGDKKTCSDINECIEQQPCAQICENSVGSYWCSCFAGFLLRPDKSSCKSIESEHYLLYTSFDQARMLSENPITLKVMWSANDSKITGMDVNIHEKRAFFTIQDSNNIYEYNLDKPSFEYLEDPGHKTKLVVDWLTNNIYVVVKNTVDSLKVCNFKKRTCARIMKFRLKDSIKSLAIDPINKILFFSVTYTSTFGIPKTGIFKSNLDGTKPISLYTGPMYVTALEADPYKKELYFMEAHSKTLQSIKYNEPLKNGGKPNIIIKKNNAIKNPSSLSIFENVAFITNTGSSEAVKCQLYGDKICNAFNLNVYNVEDIVIVAPSRQKQSTNKCLNNKCDVICVQAELGAKCICYDGKTIEPGIKCKNTILMDNDDKPIEMAQSYSDGDNDNNKNNNNIESSNATTFAICFTIMGIILLGLCGYIYYRRRSGHGNFLINMHFQNPLVRSNDEYGPSPSVTTHIRKPEITMDKNDVSNTKLPIFRPIQKFLKSSKGTHQITLETAERNGNTTSRIPNRIKDSGIGIFDESQQEYDRDDGNFNDDPKAPLVL